MINAKPHTAQNQKTAAWPDANALPLISVYQLTGDVHADVAAACALGVDGEGGGTVNRNQT